MPTTLREATLRWYTRSTSTAPQQRLLSYGHDVWHHKTLTAAWAIIKLFLDPVVCRKVSILGELGKARENRSRPRNRAARRAPRRTRAARSLSLRPLPSRFPFADDSDPPRSAPLTRARRTRDGPPRAALSGRDAAAQAGRAR